jgi:hypothetical protein
MTNIDELVEKLPLKDRDKFDKLLLDVLYDRYWCRQHGINYTDPDVKKAKEELYNQFFRSKSKEIL